MKKQADAPLVSIVIPTYNQEDFIVPCLQSVVNQTYANLEIILVDDASTDQTLPLAQTIADTDARIRLLPAEKNMGISKNFNRGFDAVKGAFVAFLGGDDIMYPQKIEKQLTFLQQHPEYVQCMHDMEFIDENAKVTQRHTDQGLIPTNPLDWVFRIDWFFKRKFTGVLPSSCLARTDYYLHARYDTDFRYKHELLFTLDNYCHQPKGKWHVLDEVLGQYRVHDSNFSMQDKNRNLILDETLLLCKIARQRYPELKERIRAHLSFVLFNNLLFNWGTEEKRAELEKAFKANSTMLEKLYLKMCKTYFALRRR